MHSVLILAVVKKKAVKCASTQHELLERTCPIACVYYTHIYSICYMSIVCRIPYPFVAQKFRTISSIMTLPLAGKRSEPFAKIIELKKRITHSVTAIGKNAFA